MADATEEVERLIEFEFWEEVALVFAGYLLPVIVQTVLEGRGILNLPNELYGVAVIVGSGYLLDGSYRASAGVGGGVYIADQAANERFGVQEQITSMAA